MKKAAKWLLIFTGVITLAVLGYAHHYAWRNGPTGTGYTSRLLCSGVFLAGRDPQSVKDSDLKVPGSIFILSSVDYDNKSASASLPILFRFKRTAIYREGLGCTLLIDATEEEVRAQAQSGAASKLPDQKSIPWPTGDLMPNTPLPPGIDNKKLSATLDDAFSEPDPKKLRRTRAVVVVYKGRLIAERYAPGFTKDTRLHGWSMTKSVTSAQIGILVGQGKLSVDKPAPVPEWKEPGDPRGEITLSHLLRMSSGLEFLEEYEDNPDSDAPVMFFARSDQAAYAANKPLEFKPDTKWSYSSGTSNMLARIVRQTVGGSFAQYYAFPRRELFDKIGMKSAILEPDASGTLIGGAHCYATARDWARFGLLYLNDGVWEGERILPKGWVQYTSTNAPAAPPDDPYGAQFWLNTDGGWMPSLPHDLYAARGHESQYVVIIPSRDLVVVRLGMTKDYRAWDLSAFLKNILEALPG